MRILFLSEFFHPTIGGIEVRALPFLQWICRRGHEVRVVVGSEPENRYPAESNYDGIRVLRVPLAEAIQAHDFPNVVAIRRQFAALKREYRQDIVHAFFCGPTAMLHLETTSVHTSPFLVSITSWVGRSLGVDSLQAKIFRSADWVTANSARLLSNVCSAVPEVTDHASVIYSGNPPTGFEPSPFDPAVRQILCVGRIVDDKGFEVVVRALPSILERFPATRLVVAGDGPSRQRLVTVAEELNLSAAVDFLGWVDPCLIAPLMGGSTVVVVPSLWEEPFASVAIQAAWACRPVIATDRGGMAEAVVDGETGLLIPANDAGAIANAVLSLFGDPDHAARLGANARSRAQSVFSWERYLDDFEGLYLRLTAHGTS